MKKLTLNLISILLALITNFQPHKCEFKERILFDLADLTIDHTDLVNSKIVQLEAFKLSTNDVILNDRDSTKYSQLKWYSIGYPKILMRKPDNGEINSLSMFTFKKNGFSIRVQMLIEGHKMEFVKSIKEKYGIVINTNQIVNLAPTNLACKLKFYSDDREIQLLGLVKNFQEYPLNIDFVAPKFTNKCSDRCLFEQYIQNDENSLNLEFDCELETKFNFRKKFTLYTNLNAYFDTSKLILDFINVHLVRLEHRFAELEEIIEYTRNESIIEIDNIKQLVLDSNYNLSVLNENITNLYTCFSNSFKTTTQMTSTSAQITPTKIKEYEVIFFLIFH